MTFTRALPFQSTFPRGERRGPYLIFLSPCRFQSTFPRGERRIRTAESVQRLQFQSTFPRGERRCVVYVGTVLCGFQSTFPRGERRLKPDTINGIIPFQSTFPRGERHTCISHVTTGHGISIHVPSWGTTANFHKYSLFFYAINIIFLLFIIPSLFSLVLFMLLF